MQSPYLLRVLVTSFETLTSTAIQRRNFWVSEIVSISGNFGQDYRRVEAELGEEVARSGTGAVLDHLRLCGAIPEQYGHDTSEEKLYSKYTDALLAVAFRSIGLTSLVLTERADAADVEVVGRDYSFVADAKAFRLSRTAKNQKDFKVQAMDGWKRGKPYAVVVCPLYQLPSRSSQIYQQAITRNVCLLSYSHLSVLVTFSDVAGTVASQNMLGSVLHCVDTLVPSKDSNAYWTAINRGFLGHDGRVAQLWRTEKIANLEAIAVAKEEGLNFLAEDREAIMKLSHQDALERLIDAHKIDSRMQIIAATADNGLLGLA